MNRKSLFFVLPLVALVLMACRFGDINLNRTVVQSSGVLKTETRPVKDIERVSLRGTGDLTIIQGNEEGLTIEADENLLPYIETTMQGRELVISLKNNISLNITNKIHYTLKVKNLNRVSVSGSGNVDADKLNVGDLALEVTGSGDMKIADLQAKNLTTRISGAGNFELKGKVQSQDATITGSGNYNAGDLQSSEAKLTISGAGNMTTWATDKMDVHITGFGNINYYGKPSLTQSISGGGGVKSLGDHK
jgi:hypothetical protein